MLDSKGCGKGVLCAVDGKGCLIQPDGQIVPQPWLDKTIANSQARALHQLTGGKDALMFYVVYVVPDDVMVDIDSLATARAFSLPALICTVAALKQGFLDRAFPEGQPPADPDDVERLRLRLSNPDLVRERE
jgi:hypothetical protein